MGTRSSIVIEDGYDRLVMYKHWDGYPRGMAHALKKTLPYAWELPRFEAADFAAAFAAGNKTKKGVDRKRGYKRDGGGNVYFYGHLKKDEDWRKSKLLPGDIEYVYHIKGEVKDEDNPFRESTVPTVTAYVRTGGWNKKPTLYHEIGNWKLGQRVTKKMIENMEKNANAAYDASQITSKSA